MSKLNIKVNKSTIFAIILLCLCVVSVYFMDGLYAKYYTQVSGNDSARVAKFQIGDSGTLTETFAIEISPSSPATKEIQIVSGSEVSVAYTITAKTLQNFPLQLAWDSGSAGETATITNTISAGDSTPKNHTLKVTWPTDGDKNNYDYSYELDYIIVTIDYVQVD